MGFIKGHTLSHYISSERLQPERQVAKAVRKLAQALGHAHKRGIVHRDLKPSNIVVSGEGQPVITDFGLAARMGEAKLALTQKGRLIGTPAYMSPEQADGESENIGPLSDVYSLGVILYQLLTGRLPFRGSVVQVIYKIISEEPDPPSEYRPDVDPRLQNLCVSMMRKHRDDRIPSMEDAANILGRLLINPRKPPTRCAAAS